MVDSDSNDSNKFEEEKIERKFEKRQNRRITKQIYSNKDEFELDKSKIKAMISQDLSIIAKK